MAPADFGLEVSNHVRLAIPSVERTSATELHGVVLKVDKFGNLITNLSEATVAGMLSSLTPEFRLKIAGRVVTCLQRSYAEGGDDELFAILGSSGYLEVAARQASAAAKLSAGVGTPVQLDYDE